MKEVFPRQDMFLAQNFDEFKTEFHTRGLCNLLSSRRRGLILRLRPGLLRDQLIANHVEHVVEVAMVLAAFTANQADIISLRLGGGRRHRR